MLLEKGDVDVECVIIILSALLSVFHTVSG